MVRDVTSVTLNLSKLFKFYGIKPIDPDNYIQGL
jgi:hypothetical protein